MEVDESARTDPQQQKFAASDSKLSSWVSKKVDGRKLKFRILTCLLSTPVISRRWFSEKSLWATSIEYGSAETNSGRENLNSKCSFPTGVSASYCFANLQFFLIFPSFCEKYLFPKLTGIDPLFHPAFPLVHTCPDKWFGGGPERGKVI